MRGDEAIYDRTLSPLLASWESFYVILGSSAAALTGLQFVVMALGAERETTGGEATWSAFATPTIVHFCAVLLIAAIVSTPGHSASSLSLCLSISGAAGLIYCGWVLLMARRQKDYAPVLEDWIFHTDLPILSYVCVFIAGVATRWHPVSALYYIAAASLLLLFTGIHNAWDAALWMSANRKQ